MPLSGVFFLLTKTGCLLLYVAIIFGNIHTMDKGRTRSSKPVGGNACVQLILFQASGHPRMVFMADPMDLRNLPFVDGHELICRDMRQAN